MRMGRLLTTRQVARRLSISVRTVDRWVESGKLPPPRIRSGWRKWDESDLRTLFEREAQENTDDS